MPIERSHDIVLFGATGFTGALTAEHLAAHAPPGSRWALAGRSGVRLQELRARLAAIDARCAELPLAVLDAADRPALRRIAATTRVLVNAVGPYTTHGDAVVAACAEQGTDYVDLAGEAEFVDLSYVRHHDRAVRTHARLVHSCGFDSIPFDLGTLHTLMQLPEGVPIRVRAFAQLHLGGMRSAARGFSTGSVRSALVMLSRPRRRSRARSARLALEALPEHRTVEVPLCRPHRPREMEGWALPAPRFDSQVVSRSAAALDRYGPNFSYEQYVLVRRLGTAAGAVGFGGVMLTLARLRPVRELILARLPSRAGPTASERERRRFTVTLIGDGGGRRVLTEVCGGDPGYGESAKMLAEAALCLAHDELPRCSGQVTPATAMGEILIDRLERQGITFTSRGE
ncbi:MAG: saccharopine dehydrogenase family protein [Solirubrobacteraceae bacterium]